MFPNTHCLTNNAPPPNTALNLPLPNARYAWFDGKTASMLVPEMSLAHPSPSAPNEPPPNGISWFSTTNETAAAGGWFPLSEGVLTDSDTRTAIARTRYHAGAIGSDVVIQLGQPCSNPRCGGPGGGADAA